MDAESLGQFLMLVFAPHIPVLAGAVVALLGLLIVVVIFREFLPEE